MKPHIALRFKVWCCYEGTRILIIGSTSTIGHGPSPAEAYWDFMLKRASGD